MRALDGKLLLPFFGRPSLSRARLLSIIKSNSVGFTLLFRPLIVKTVALLIKNDATRPTSSLPNEERSTRKKRGRRMTRKPRPVRIEDQYKKKRL